MGNECSIKLRVASLRKGMNITQEELANALGISFQSVSKWETESGYPDIAMLPRLSEYFAVSVDYLLGISQSKSNQNTYESLQKYFQNTDENAVHLTAYNVSVTLFEAIASRGYREDFNGKLVSSFVGNGPKSYLYADQNGFAAMPAGMTIIGYRSYIHDETPSGSAQSLCRLFDVLKNEDLLSLLSRLLKNAYDNDNPGLSKQDIAQLSSRDESGIKPVLKELVDAGLLFRGVDDEEEIFYRFPEKLHALLYPLLLTAKAVIDSKQ